jgi:DNA-binding NarL/FixJ family response regulator
MIPQSEVRDLECATPIRVILADDHPVVMRGFAIGLADHGIEVVGMAKTTDEAFEFFERHLPDVIVLDIRFGTASTGLDVAERILAKHPKARIVFLSQFDQRNLIQKSYVIGGKAFMKKSCEPEELSEAIRAAAADEQYFMADVAKQLASLAIQPASPLAVLDERESSVLKLMALGLTNQEIANELNLSLKTISNTSQTIKDKLHEDRASRLTLLAVKHGLVDAQAAVF